jgi:hypothetical protein
MLSQRSEGAFEHGEAGLDRGEAVAAGGGGWITVQADDPARCRCENGAAVSAPAEGRIDEELSCGRGEGGEHGVDEDRLVAHDRHSRTIHKLAAVVLSASAAVRRHLVRVDECRKFPCLDRRSSVDMMPFSFAILNRPRSLRVAVGNGFNR